MTNEVFHQYQNKDAFALFLPSILQTKVEGRWQIWFSFFFFLCHSYNNADLRIIIYLLLESTIQALFYLHRGRQLIPYIEAFCHHGGSTHNRTGSQFLLFFFFPVYPFLHSTSWQTLNSGFGYLSYFTRNEKNMFLNMDVFSYLG